MLSHDFAQNIAHVLGADGDVAAQRQRKMPALADYEAEKRKIVRLKQRRDETLADSAERLVSGSSPTLSGVSEVVKRAC